MGHTFGIKYLIRNTTPIGWVLLARPVMYALFSRRRDLDDYAAIDFSALIFILYSFVAFFWGLKVIRDSNSNFGNNIIRRTPILLFGIYCVLGLVSMAWSVNYMLTGFRVFECVAMTILIIAVIQDLFETCDLRFVFTWSLFYCTVDILSALWRTSMWASDIRTYLESSQMMSTCFFFMALYFVPRRWNNWLIIVMSVMSASTTAYIGMAIGMISSFWQKGHRKLFVMMGAVALIVLVLYIGPYAILKDTIFYDKSDISIEQTSGRDHLMDTTFRTLDQYPYGLGFFAAEPYIIYATGMRGAISAHNSIFSASMGMGWPGIIVISLFFLALTKITFSKYIPSDYRPIAIGCFCVAFLHCMGNPSVGTRVFGAWMPCMYIFVLNCGLYIYGKYYETIHYEIVESEESEELLPDLP